jgi:D-glycero-D-manno-heptose 1,7-bisphosphate phosphatase
MIPLHTIDKSWSLFLDRDGVINHEKNNDYIHTWNEFVFYEGVLEAFRIFKQYFNRIIIITNQRGVGKGLTLAGDLQMIHDNMEEAVKKEGGHIDAVYYCSALDENHPNRKPNPGMGLQATKQFPDIDLKKAIMVGNSISDIEFGRNLGVYTVFLPTTKKEVNINDKRIDAVYESLISFAHSLQADKL